ncbi:MULTISPECIES: antibiotic biosynthesis monooxygenase [unclassified Isoptericola]|uniref:antibiotic biosynthesis monooxygenase n=1 Tax=Isoptericola sp. NPDC057191 TaxID=3346041 RepID=UPI003626758B
MTATHRPGTTVEITRFRVPADAADRLLAARPGMLAAFAAGRTGFLGAELVRLDADTWVDVVHWASPEDLAASRRRGGDDPAVAAFFDPITELVSSESGTTADQAPAQHAR